MLNWALTFLIVALIVAAFGFSEIGGSMAGLAQILFFVFLILFVISLIGGGFRRPYP